MKHREAVNGAQTGEKVLRMAEWCGRNLEETVEIKAGTSMGGAYCVDFIIEDETDSMAFILRWA